MTLQDALEKPQGFEGLRTMSAAFGQDRLHIQGAGGNASIKDGDTMWIKASGTMLGDALTRDVFVPVDLGRMKTAVKTNQPNADSPADFLIPGASDLRPSIETSLHAVLPQRVVLHTHCIHTIAHAVQTNAADLLADRLQNFDWAFVPYTKPGANLARSVLAAISAKTDVVVLGNHGLIVAGETVADVTALQNAVHAALALPPIILQGENTKALLKRVDDNSYDVPDDPFLHQLALSERRVTQVTAGSLYPDHVIFCGIAVPAMDPHQTTDSMQAAALKIGGPEPVCFVVPGAGVLVRKDASAGAKTMLRCLADVIVRLPKDADLTYLSMDQNLELLDWDAEKYRQALNAE